MAKEKIRHEYFIFDKEIIKAFNLKGNLISVEGWKRAVETNDGETRIITEEMI